MNNRRYASDDWPLLSRQHEDQKRLMENVRMLREVSYDMQQKAFEIRSLLEELKAIKSQTEYLRAEISTFIEKLNSEDEDNSNEDL